jgi:hypothetical protein
MADFLELGWDLHEAMNRIFCLQRLCRNLRTARERGGVEERMSDQRE